MGQPTRASKRDLEDKTEQYWRYLKKLDSADKLLETSEWYIDELLPLEMTWIWPDSPRPERDYRTLVLLVGYSLEPLLQTICFYQPGRLVLVLSEHYGSEMGDVMGRHIEGLVERLVQRGLLEGKPTVGPREKEDQGCFLEVKPDPAVVFQLLLSELRGVPPEEVVVDITGARKSMVVGAFFYAAFANVAISYVEFDDTDYNLTLGRPQGYLSVILRLPNPYATFALREWGRVRHLYTHYDFRSATETLVQDILPTMTQPAPNSGESLFGPEHVQATKKLIEVLEFYECWDRGDFRSTAPTLLPRAEQPLAMQELAELLPTRLDPDDGERAAAQLVNHLDKQLHLDGANRPFLLQPRLLGIYAADEIARIGRMIDLHQDYRSALMRAIGLYELLLHVRILTLWCLGQLEYRIGKDSPWQPLSVGSSDWQKQYEPLVKMQGLENYEELAYKRKSKFLNKTSTYVCWPDDQEWEIPIGAQLPHSIRELRHKTTHRTVPVPEDTARLALKTLQASFENYRDRWAPHLEPDLDLPAPNAPAYRMRSWEKICEWCGLNQVLPPNLLRDERSEV